MFYGKALQGLKLTSCGCGYIVVTGIGGMSINCKEFLIGEGYKILQTGWNE